MQKIADIPGIEETSLELLEAAGFRCVESLARAGVEPLTNELIRANEMLKIAKQTPGRSDVEMWIRTSREAIGEADEAPVAEAESVIPVDYEAMPEVASILAAAPCAIPFPGRWLAESDIPVVDIVPGALLNRYAGDLEVRVEENLPTQRAEEDSHVPANSYVHVADKPRAMRHEIDATKLRSIEEYSKETASATRRTSRHTHVSHVERERELIREPRPETNAGKDINSRRYIRGVLHSNPWALRVGAVMALLLFMVIPLSLVITVLLLLQDGNPEAYHWVRPWWVVFPFLVPLFGVFWLLWSYSCACRICRQKLFVPKKHRKNPKAHHIPLLGYIFPLSLHLLVFQWFRCTHCGTPVRLKK